MKAINLDPWNVISFWASNQIHPKYGVTYEVIVNDLADFPAYLNNDIEDVQYYESLWRQRYNLTFINKDSIRNLEDEVWVYLMEEAKKDNAFEGYLKSVNEQKEKALLTAPENYSYTHSSSGHHHYFHRGRHDKLSLPNSALIIEQCGVGLDNLIYVGHQSALRIHLGLEVNFKLIELN